MTMQELYEQDRERLLSRLGGADRPAVIREVGAQLDRVLAAFCDSESSDRVREEASRMIQAVKSAAGLIDTEGETKIYERTEYSSGAGRSGRQRFPVRFWVFLLLGLCLTAAAIVTCLVNTSATGLRDVLFLIVGIVFAGGFFFLAGHSARGTMRKGKEKTQLQAETCVDPQKVYHHMLAAVLTVDRELEKLRSEERIRERRELAGKSELADSVELEFFSGLLEELYGRRESDPLAQEWYAQVKYYLHRKQIDVVDLNSLESYLGVGETPGNAQITGWFDRIPACGAGTIRPALAMGGTLLKKGLASNG